MILVNKLYRFQVYTSMIHHLYIALCAHHLKSYRIKHPKSHQHIFDLLYPLLPQLPFPLVTTILLSVSISFCLFSFLFICFFQFCIPHMSKIIWFLTFSVWLILLSMLFSRSSHIVWSKALRNSTYCMIQFYRALK